MSVAQDVAQALGAKGPSRGWWKTNCIYHDDKSPSLSFSENGYNCFSCEAHGHINKLAEDLGIRERTDFRRKMTRKNSAPDGRTSEYEAMSALQTTRGLRPETIAEFEIRFEPKKRAYSYRDESWPTGTVRYKSVNGRSPRYFWGGHQKGADLYGLSSALTFDTDFVWLVEGEPDVWTMYQAGLPAVSFTDGAKSVPDGAVRTLTEGGVGNVRIVYDTDEPGLRGSFIASEKLTKAGVATTVLTLPDRLPPASDVSDLYGDVDRDDEAFREAIQSLEELPEPPPGIKSEPHPHLTHKDRSDADNAERLVQLHGEGLHYIAKWKKWIVFIEDQQTWLKDDADVQVRELAKAVGRSLKEQFVNIPPEDLSKWASFVVRSLSNAGITGMVNLARGVEGIPLDHEQLDSDGWMLGVENGVVDLKTGELRPADPADLMTMQCPVVFDPKAKCSRFEQAMEEWFPDEEVRGYVQRVAGSALVGFQRDHVFIIHYGGGRNGKGTFTRALQNVLGPYARVIHLSLLVHSKGSQHDTIKADLFRARLAVASELKSRISLDEASVKNLTGGDRITARQMHQDPWEFDPSHSLWLQTNYLPKISGRDTGIWSRIRVVKWETTFAPDEQDQTLDDVLAAEAPGILNWLLKGCLAWQQHGLNEPEAVLRETLAYRDQEDRVKMFMNDVGLALDPNLEITSPELQRLFREWSEEAGLKDPPRSDLKKVLEDVGCTLRNSRIDGKRVRVWEGFGLQQTEEDDEYERDEREGMQQH